MNEHDVAQLIDVPVLQGLMESLHRATGIKHALMDLDNTILSATGWAKACTDYHRANPRSCERCLESDRYIFKHLGDGGYVGYTCLNGLADYAVPVFVNGEHVANMFTGQILHAPPDMAYFRRQAKEFGFDEQPYLDAIRQIPIVPKEHMPDIMAFLKGIAEFLGRQGAARHQLQKEIADRRQAEELARQRSEELQAAYKELEAFSFSVSHDLRVPLRAIDGFSRMLEEDYADKLGDEGKRMIDVVRSNAQRMNRLIEDILAFSRTGRAEMRMSRVDMAELAGDVWNELASSMEGRNVAINIGILPAVQGDSALLRQVFVNLFSNAIKFTRLRDDARIDVEARTEGGEQVFCVRDNGVGFDMKYYDKLFGVFQRLHSLEDFEGTGIGLAIVKRIITRHGGRVWADANVGQGAAFSFSLPERKDESQ
ncbi:MAG TPA: PocR ligand-binding domain-containing protein [Noviherbaspirillum sp.]